MQDENFIVDLIVPRSELAFFFLVQFDHFVIGKELLRSILVKFSVPNLL
jgi:hypothetical protein